jgi:hypothetical protein
VDVPKTLLLTETGVESLPDGSTAVNVGPIVRALKFLTEGRGDDRGADEAGNPLPDLMSLAFDVVESIIVGGRKADYFRQVKRELEAHADGAGRSSLALAKHAKRVQRPEQSEALAHATSTAQATLAELAGATTQLLAAMKELGVAPKAGKKAKRKASRSRPATTKKKPKAASSAKPKKAAPRKRKRR